MFEIEPYFNQITDLTKTINENSRLTRKRELKTLLNSSSYIIITILLAGYAGGD